jgi:hypothetical protein
MNIKHDIAEMNRLAGNQYPYNWFSAFVDGNKGNGRFAKKGDYIVVVQSLATCCCPIGQVVRIHSIDGMHSITVLCPVFGEHEFGSAYNKVFRFMDGSRYLEEIQNANA